MHILNNSQYFGDFSNLSNHGQEKVPRQVKLVPVAFLSKLCLLLSSTNSPKKFISAYRLTKYLLTQSSGNSTIMWLNVTKACPAFKLYGRPECAQIQLRALTPTCHIP